MIDSIEKRLENLLATAEREVQSGFRSATAQAAGRGALQSGGHLITKIRVLGDAMDRFVESAARDAEAIENRGGVSGPLYEGAITKLIQLKLRSLDDLRKKSEWAVPSALAAMLSEAETRYEFAQGSWRIPWPQVELNRPRVMSSSLRLLVAEILLLVRAGGAGASTSGRVRARAPGSTLGLFTVLGIRRKVTIATGPYSCEVR